MASHSDRIETRRSGYGAGTRSAQLRGLLAAAAALTAAQLEACGSAKSPTSGGDGDPANPAAAPLTPSAAPNPSSAGFVGLVDGASESSTPPEPTVDPACVVSEAQAEVTREPVDVILILDNSSSMTEEAAAVEENLNVAFAELLAASGVDYRVILLSKHRAFPRTEFDAPAICIDVPLSNLPDCEDPTGVPQPTFSDRFFHYSTQIESRDSLDILLDSYEPPFDYPWSRDEFDRAPQGWSTWLRPGARSVFLELTDDNSGLSALTFIAGLQGLDPERFGSNLEAPTFTFHSIVGLREKTVATEAYLPTEPVMTERCSGENQTVANAGPVYQDLSRLTGGLRFPLCEFNGYSVVFQAIAENVADNLALSCTFPVPVPPVGKNLDLEKIAVSAQLADGNALRLGRALTDTACGADAFLVQDGLVQLCPEACTTLRAEREVSVTVQFACDSTVILR
jgi:hypothetical protein